MTAKEFCYWIQGYFEIMGSVPSTSMGQETLHVDQVECIKKHLNMVFIHDIDPSYPAHQQAALNEAHKPSLVARPEKVLMRC